MELLLLGIKFVVGLVGFILYVWGLILILKWVCDRVPDILPEKTHKKHLSGWFNGKSYMRGRAKVSVKKMLGIYRR